MFQLMKQVFIALLSFSRYLARKCVSLSNELCLTRRTLIDINPAELKFCPLMIRSGKCNEGCNVADELSTKIYIPMEVKYVNVKLFNTLIRLREAQHW